MTQDVKTLLAHAAAQLGDEAKRPAAALDFPRRIYKTALGLERAPARARALFGMKALSAAGGLRERLI